MKISVKGTGIIIAMLLALGAVFGIYAERIEPMGFETLRRPASLFDHDEHNDAAGIDDCAVCHHLYEDGMLVEDESSEDSYCSDCHEVKASDQNSVSLTAAFHTRCKSCHFEENKGPVLCGECHQKE